MPFTDRRSILRLAAMLPVMAGATSAAASAQTASAKIQNPAQAFTEAPKDVTRILAHYVVTA